MAFWRGLTPKLSSGGLLGTILGKPIKRLPSAAADCSALVAGCRAKTVRVPFDGMDAVDPAETASL